MTLRICVSILPKNSHEALDLIKRAEKAKADLVEVRMDCLENLASMDGLVEKTKLPLIATNKLVSEKGFFAGSESERQQSLLNAAENGFQYVDVDLSSLNHQETIKKIKPTGTKTIVSYHKYDGALSASEMEGILEQEISLEASICKIVGTAKTIRDNLPALNFLSSHSRRRKLVCFCMGDAGRVSRILSPIFGGYFTFASLEQGGETAKGQMTISEVRQAYDLLGA